MYAPLMHQMYLWLQWYAYRQKRDLHLYNSKYRVKKGGENRQAGDG